MSCERVLEELCTSDTCLNHETTHWHPFDINDFLREEPGEYTVVLRVREKSPPKRRRKAGKR